MDDDALLAEQFVKPLPFALLLVDEPVHFGLDLGKLYDYDIILLDLNLPDMSGTDILERVKGDERLRRAPVVVLTTTDDKVEIQRCYDLGCNVYITKPVDYESFAGAIRQLGLFLSVIQVPDVAD